MKHVARQRGSGPRSGRSWRCGAAGALLTLAAPLGMAQPGDGAEAASMLPRVDLLLLTQPPPADGPSLNWAPAGRPGRAQALDLGLQWKAPPVAGWHVGARLWRRVSPDSPASAALHGEPAASRYGAGLEMELPEKKRLSLRDLLGVQLDNGARLSLGRKNGKVSVYYKLQF